MRFRLSASSSVLPASSTFLRALARTMPKAETALFKKILNPSNHFPPIRQTKFSAWNLKMKNDLPKRKPNRLKGFDYSSDGAYFITICTKNKEQCLSKIVGANIVRPSAIGKIIEKDILKIEKIYPCIFVDSYVIMPNHIHLLYNRCDRRGDHWSPNGINC